VGSEPGLILDAVGIRQRFGALVVLDGVDFAVGERDAVGIVGPNGAGKTTLLNVLSGALRPTGGRVSLRGRDVTNRSAAARCRLGIGRAHQVPKPFGAMTVFENVLVAAQQGSGRRGRASYAAAADILDLTGLAADANNPAERLGLLSRKRLELARALATKPKLLLLDEVAGGLTDPEVAQLVKIVNAVRAEGVAILWIEHVVHALTATVHRLLCLYGGAFIGDGEPDDVLALPAVREVFLGTEVTASLHLPATGPQSVAEQVAEQELP